MAHKLGSGKNNGPAAFEEWYGAMHGDRWNRLRAACLQAPRHFRLESGLNQPYFLDPASVVAALQVPVGAGSQILDMCAAPGGKSLILAIGLFELGVSPTSLSTLGSMVDDRAPTTEKNDLGERAHTPLPEPTDGVFRSHEMPRSGNTLLCVNERSAIRRGRLRRVLHQHLPPRVLPNIQICGHDANSWGLHQQNVWDSVLLDIPCSSERHLLNDPSYLNEWSPKRSTQLAQQAYTMALSAAQALKAGGTLVFSTCALSELENDATIKRLLDRSKSQESRYGFCLELDNSPITSSCAPVPMPEPTLYGYRVWPDTHDGFGPIYFSRLKKIEKGACG